MKYLVVILTVISIVCATPTHRTNENHQILKRLVSSNVEFDLEEEQKETVGTTSTHAPTITTLKPFPNNNKVDGSVSSLSNNKLSTNWEFETKYVTHTELVTESAPPTKTFVSSTKSSKPEIESTVAGTLPTSTTMSTMSTVDQSSISVIHPQIDNQKTISKSNVDDSKPNIASTVTDGTTATTTTTTTTTTPEPEMESTVSGTSAASVKKTTMSTTDQTSISVTNPQVDNQKTTSKSNVDDSKPNIESTVTDGTTATTTTTTTTTTTATTTTTPKAEMESTVSGISTSSVKMTTMSTTDQTSISVTNLQVDNQEPISGSNVDHSKPNIEFTVTDGTTTTTITTTTTTATTTTTPKPEMESTVSGTSTSSVTMTTMPITDQPTIPVTNSQVDNQEPTTGSNSDDTKPDIGSTITDSTTSTASGTPNMDSHAAAMASVSNNQDHFDAGHTDSVTMSPSTEMNNKADDRTTQTSTSNVLDEIGKNCNATVQELKDKDVPILIEIDHGDLSPGDSTISVTTIANEMIVENEAKNKEVTSKQPNVLDQIADTCSETKEKCEKNNPIKTEEIDQNVDVITTATSTNEATQASNVMKESVEETSNVSSPLIPSTVGSPSNTETVDEKGHEDYGSTLTADEATTIDPENDSNTLRSSINIVLPLLLAILISNNFN